MITSLREISRNHACLQCKITNHNDAMPILFQLKSSLSFSSCDSRVPPLNLYYDVSIAEDLHCLKAVDRNFVRNGGTTRTHLSLCSWAGALQLRRCFAVEHPDAVSDSVRIAIHFFVNFDIFKWLYLSEN